MMYKLKDNDVVKILPILKKKGGFSPVEELKGFFIGDKVIYDTPENHLRIALKNKSHENGEIKFTSIPNTKIALCIYHQGEIKFTLVNKTIKDKLINGYKFDPRNNYQLKVNIEIKVNNVGKLLQSYGKSEIIQQDWDKPNIDIDNQEAWFEWLRTKQSFYIEDYIEKNNVFNNIDILKKEGLSDYIYEIIAKNRENKINQVLN